VPDGDDAIEIERLGRELHAAAEGIGSEREGFLTWLGDVAGARVRTLAGWTRLREYDRREVAELIEVLAHNGRSVRVDPRSRAFRDALATEVARSRAVIADLEERARVLASEAEQRVGDLYGLSAAQRAIVAEDSPRAR
jgi:hypothetical protein